MILSNAMTLFPLLFPFLARWFVLVFLALELLFLCAGFIEIFWFGLHCCWLGLASSDVQIFFDKNRVVLRLRITAKTRALTTWQLKLIDQRYSIPLSGLFGFCSGNKIGENSRITLATYFVSLSHVCGWVTAESSNLLDVW